MIADMWVDPVCPWTWLTTRWIVQVERVRDVEVRFHVMSLSVLNEGRTDVPEFYQQGVARWWGPVRVLVAAEQGHGSEVVRPLYDALASRIHREDQPYAAPLYRAALEEVALPLELADAAGTTEYDDELRASHHEAALKSADAELGSPVIHLPGPDGTTAVFGPVVSPAPTGEDAGRLWDATLLAVRTPGFYELKRARDVDPIVD